MQYRLAVSVLLVLFAAIAPFGATTLPTSAIKKTGAKATPAKRKLAPLGMGMATEGDNHYNSISPNGGPQPTIAMSVCAVPLINGVPAGAGYNVHFAADDGDPSLNWTLSATDVTTNAKGQAIIQVTPRYHAYPITLSASFTVQGRTGSAGVPLTPVANDCQALHNTPFLTTSDGSYVKRYSRCGIPYFINSRFQDAILAAMGEWHATGYFNFVQGTANNATVSTFVDDCDVADGYIGLTTYDARVLLDGTVRIVSTTTKFNIHILDGDPTRAGCDSFYPPKESHHNLVDVAAHEIGHTLGFDHNPWDLVALMSPDLNSYFVCGTQGPTADETNMLPTVYISACQ